MIEPKGVSWRCERYTPPTLSINVRVDSVYLRLLRLERGSPEGTRP